MTGGEAGEWVREVRARLAGAERAGVMVDVVGDMRDSWPVP